jgi:hypothetical protein
MKPHIRSLLSVCWEFLGKLGKSYGLWSVLWFNHRSFISIIFIFNNVNCLNIRVQLNIYFFYFYQVILPENGFFPFIFPHVPQFVQSSPFNSPFSSFPFLFPPKSMAKNKIYPKVTWDWENPFSSFPFIWVTSSICFVSTNHLSPCPWQLFCCGEFSW